MFDKKLWGEILRTVVIILGVVFGVQVCPMAGCNRTPPPCDHPPTPPTPPTPPAAPKPDPLAAIVRISAPGVGCSATIIGPRRLDGRYDVLSAAHCVSGKGQRWTMRFRDGRVLGATVVNFDKTADWCWMVTDTNTEPLPFALLLDRPWKVGEKVWHAGFGVDKPANTEHGEITGGPTDRDQVVMRLSVSSGDSGGGIALTADGHVLSTVCCTYSWPGHTDTRGATPEAIRRGRGAEHLSDEWQPIPLPNVMPKRE